MAASRTLGKSSSEPQQAKSWRHQLVQISTSPGLQLILQALGPKSELHLVGGVVRNSIQGLDSPDIDLATRLLPDEIKARLEGAEIKTIDYGFKHGTITAVVDRQHYEITTFRLAGPHNSAKVAKSIEEDLSGRDFTINAIAFSVEGSTILDPCGGVSDLSQNILRCVGNPEDVYAHDPIRLMRLIRFGPAAKRSVETNSYSSAQKLAGLINSVSLERVREELRKIIMSSDPAAGIRYLHQLGLMEHVLPEALPSVGFEQNEFHTQDVFEHTLSVLAAAPADEVVRLAALFHDLGKPATFSVGDDGRRHFYQHERVSADLARSAMERLKFSNDMTDAVLLLVRHHMRPLDCGPAGVRRIMRDLGDEFDRWQALKRADAPPVLGRENFEARLASFNTLVDTERQRLKGSVYGKLAVNGTDLLELGYKSGKFLGQALKQLEEIVIENPECNERELLLSKAAVILKDLSE